jgi:hypothetical protein
VDSACAAKQRVVVIGGPVMWLKSKKFSSKKVSESLSLPMTVYSEHLRIYCGLTCVMMETLAVDAPSLKF